MKSAIAIAWEAATKKEEILPGIKPSFSFKWGVFWDTLVRLIYMRHETREARLKRTSQLRRNFMWVSYLLISILLVVSVLRLFTVFGEWVDPALVFAYPLLGGWLLLFALHRRFRRLAMDVFCDFWLRDFKPIAGIFIGVLVFAVEFLGCIGSIFS